MNIFDAIIKNNIESLKKIIYESENINKLINVKNIEGYTPICLALKFNDFFNNDDIIDFLLDNGANIYIKNDHINFNGTNIYIQNGFINFSSPLLIACYHSKIKNIKKILDIAKKDGIDIVNKTSMDDITPMYVILNYRSGLYESYNNMCNMVELLLNYNYKMESVDLYKQIMFYLNEFSYKINQYSSDYTFLLIKYIDISLFNTIHNNLTIFAYLCKHASLFHHTEHIFLEAIKILLKRKIDVNIYTHLQYSPLYIACKYNNLILVRLLVKYNNIIINHDLCHEICQIEHLSPLIFEEIYQIESNTKSAAKNEISQIAFDAKSAAKNEII